MTSAPVHFLKPICLLIGTYIIILVFLFLKNPILTGITITLLLGLTQIISQDVHYNTIIELTRLLTNQTKLTEFLFYFFLELLGGFLAVKTYKYFNRK